MKGHKYIAWDFAYTPNGWVLIEGNWGQFLSQFATGKGLRKRFEKLMNNQNDGLQKSYKNYHIARFT